MNPEKALLVASLTITSICYIALFVTSAILFTKTRLKGFSIMSAGFGLWILEQLLFFFSGTDFLVSYGKHLGYIGTLGLVLLSIGFIGLLRGSLTQNLS